uniref:Uncharacterized protein n=1 Tax=Timema bartmani TaxID=61472 RepID=A0A7R9EMB7_9NEOP|nr:unnamed protein product [Timema bartmani]
MPGFEIQPPRHRPTTAYLEIVGGGESGRGRLHRVPQEGALGGGESGRGPLHRVPQEGALSPAHQEHLFREYTLLTAS